MEQKSQTKEEKKSESHWEYYHSNLDETPTFDSNERSRLENQIYEYFSRNGLIKSELSSEESTVTNITQVLQSKLKDAKSIQQFTYSNKQKSPLFAKKTDNNHLKSLAQIPHNSTLWHQTYLDCKKNGEWNFVIHLWMLIQHQTVHLFTHKYNLPSSIRNQLQHCIGYSDKNKPQTLKKKSLRSYLNKMEIGTQNMDCIVVGIHLKKAGYNPVILNLANQESPAAATHSQSEGGTQEENIMKRTSLYLSLWPHKNPNRSHNPAYEYGKIWANEAKEQKQNESESSLKKRKGKKSKKKKFIKGGYYPMHDRYGGIYSQNVYVMRGSQSSGYAMLPLEQRCVMSFIAVAARVHQSMKGLTKNEIDAYKHKIRTIFNIAYENGHDAIVLGALGCGIFNNPPEEVAKIFSDVLMNEFKGCFARVVFAILWDHNSKPLLVESFCKYFPQNEKMFDKL